MSAPINFESSWEKKKQKNQLREAREHVLQKAKRQYEQEEIRKEEARKRGEDTWMLPALSDRLEQDKQEYLTTKSKKKKKDKKHKTKKHKKDKKAKKSKRRDSSSSSESDDKEEWVEKTTTAPAAPVRGPVLERDSWMSAPDIFGGVTRDEIKAQKKKDEPPAKDDTSKEMEMGQHSRELNPYWKDGGSGLPEEAPPSKRQPSQSEEPKKAVIGDCGVGWLKKAYKRCQDEAESSGKSLEEIAAQRFGSLENLKGMLEEAETNLAKSKEKVRQSRGDPYTDSRHRRRSAERDYRRDSYRSRHESPQRSRDRYKDWNSDHRRDKYSENESSRSGSGKFLKPEQESNKDRRSDHRSDRHSGNESSRSGMKALSGKLMKPGQESGESHKDRHSDHRSDRHSENESSRVGMKAFSGKFMKPGQDSDDSRAYKRPSDRSTDGCPAWKKKSFMKPDDQKEQSTSGSRTKESKRSKATEKSKQTECDVSESESSSSSSSSPSEVSDQSESEDDEMPSAPAVLSEQEMNELGAKILRAELMGDNELASELKNRLTTAREAAKQSPAQKSAASSKKSSNKDEVVMLTRTDRHGVSRPVAGDVDLRKTTHGRKRKSRKVATHSKSGERERYFADDDQFSLKNMVASERLGTAQDSNLEFARLAGKVRENTDADDRDDVMLETAANKAKPDMSQARDIVKAMQEHKQRSAALSKCQFCFENVSKHLIVAIGIKVYLCLPSHKSLADGHCLIVPMVHAAPGTQLDEDVWHEIQVFRKGLTAMFKERDEDCVFMETTMALRRFPHMYMECVPLPQELGDMAPIYFKKAIQECETEWSQNKKLVDLRDRTIHNAVPRGFPYFSVDFGLQGGFAHVIEDEKDFPSYFGREVLGGMLDVEPSCWRKPRRENFDTQRRKVLEFAELWKPFDWTRRLKKSSAEEDSEETQKCQTEKSDQKTQEKEDDSKMETDSSDDSMDDEDTVKPP